jgi:pyrimidine operon attenuation protein / uracil phosphoribosyltransferase
VDGTCYFCAQMSKRVQIISKEVIAAKISRMALEIIEQNFDEKSLIIIGVQGRGTDVATCLQAEISKHSSLKTQLRLLKIDKNKPIDAALEDETGLENAVVVLVDDVVNSGRTLLYACTPLLHHLLKKLQVAVLVDRSHKSYPISADFVGTSVATTLQEHISVEVKNGEILGAYLS